MRNRSVLVHTCFNPEIENYGGACGCEYWIRLEEAKTLIGRGDAKKLLIEWGNGKFYPDNRAVVIVGKIDRLPIAETIVERHIRAAFINGAERPGPAIYQQRRIETYGESTQRCFADLGAELIGMKIIGSLSQAAFGGPLIMAAAI